MPQAYTRCGHGMLFLLQSIFTLLPLLFSSSVDHFGWFILKFALVLFGRSMYFALILTIYGITVQHMIIFGCVLCSARMRFLCYMIILHTMAIRTVTSWNAKQCILVHGSFNHWIESTHNLRYFGKWIVGDRPSIFRSKIILAKMKEARATDRTRNIILNIMFVLIQIEPKQWQWQVTTHRVNSSFIRKNIHSVTILTKNWKFIPHEINTCVWNSRDCFELLLLQRCKNISSMNDRSWISGLPNICMLFRNSCWWLARSSRDYSVTFNSPMPPFTNIVLNTLLVTLRLRSPVLSV